MIEYIKAIYSILKEISEEDPSNIRYPEWILFGLGTIFISLLFTNPFNI